jgi:hypothetical protein
MLTREAAVQKITDKAILKEIAVESSESWVREAAEEKLKKIF